MGIVGDALAQGFWFGVASPDAFLTKRHVSLAFVSQNLHAPVSMFGHTFVVAHDDEEPEPDSVVVEFLGRTDQSRLPELAAISTGLVGEFRLGHLIYKMREYDGEDRDVWFYRLTLMPGEREHLASNVRDGMPQQRVYRFQTTNCSYHVAALIAEALSKNRACDGSLEAFGYVLPIDTVRYLRSCGVVGKASVALSSARMAEAGGSANAVDEFAYRFSREPDPERRLELFRAVKSADDQGHSTDRPSDPSETSFGGLWGIGVEGEGQVARLLIRPALRDLRSTMADGLDAAFLEILTSDIAITRDAIALRRFSLLTLDAAVPGGRFRAPFVRYIDVSYWDHSLEGVLVAKELVLKGGPGVVVGGDRVSAAITAYAGGGRFESNEVHGLTPDFGVRLSVFGWTYGAGRLRGVYDRRLTSRFAFDGLVEIGAAFPVQTRLVLGGEVSLLLKGSRLVAATPLVSAGWMY